LPVPCDSVGKTKKSPPAWPFGETDQAQKLARAALAVQTDLTVKYVRDQE